MEHLRFSEFCLFKHEEGNIYIYVDEYILLPRKQTDDVISAELQNMLKNWMVLKLTHI